MNVVFDDTLFYVAMGNLNDSVHRKAHAFTEKFFGKVLTTDFVVVETGNFFSRTEDRISFGYLLDYLDKDVNTEVLPATRIFEQGYRSLSEPSRQELVSHRLHFICCDAGP